jgi:hypothetical protein
MRASVCIDTGIRKLEALHGTTMYKVFLHDLFRIFRFNKTVPDSLRIHHKHGGVLALVKASSRVYSNFMLQPRLLDGIFQRSAKLFSVLVGATGTRCRLVAFIQADKQVMFVIWHRNIRCSFLGRRTRTWRAYLRQ